MARDPRIAARLDKLNDSRIAARLGKAKVVFAEIAQLERRATHARVQSELGATATRLQDSLMSLGRQAEYIDSSNALDLFDRAIDRAMGEVDFVWKLLDEKGPDAAWPLP
jgi:hypothetical protein